MEYSEPVIREMGSFAALTLTKEFGSPSDGQFSNDPLGGPPFELTNSS